MEAIEEMPREAKTRRLDFEMFPHVPDVLDAFDNPDIHEITCQWGAQLAKTFSIQLCLASVIANNPLPCVFADADERSVLRVFKRFWQLLNKIPEIREVLPPPHAQRDDFIETKVCVVHGAWAGSASMAADYPAAVVILNECDKMVPLSTRSEADFRLAIRDRTSGYKNPKIINISTPSVTTRSFVEGRRFLGDNRRREVPCPRCGHFQCLRTGDGKRPGGLKFDRLNGKLHAETAEATAWYECEMCRGRIEEGDRWKMCNAGLWVPEGCSVIDSKIVGTPTRPGRHASFGPLHSLHSLMPGITLGTQARKYVEALLDQNRSEAIRKWMNSEEGETWNPAPPAQLMSSLESRLAEDRPVGVVPPWVRFVTIGADVSSLGDSDNQFHWFASGWGEKGRGCLIDFGTVFTRAQFREWVEKVQFACPERGGFFIPSISLVDSGSFTNTIYEFCDASKGKLTPIKGSSSDGTAFARDGSMQLMAKGAFRGEAEAWKKRLKVMQNQFDLIEINTHLTQQWCEDRLRGVIGSASPSWYSFPRELFSVEKMAVVDLPKHLVGDYLHDGRWDKRYEDQHYRDAWRYSRVAAEIHTKNGTLWDSIADCLQTSSSARPVISSAFIPGVPGMTGTHFLFTDRTDGES